jgi:hypothetical protein
MVAGEIWVLILQIGKQISSKPKSFPNSIYLIGYQFFSIRMTVIHKAQFILLLNNIRFEDVY